MTFRAFRSLRWLADNPQSDSLPEDVCPSEDARVVFEELKDLRLVHDTATLDGSFDFLLTSSGEIQARNARDSYRAELVRRSVLSSIAAEGSADGLVGSAAGEDFSGPITTQEVRFAFDDLDDRGLITGTRNANNEFTFVELTSAGRGALSNPHLIDSVVDPRPAVSHHVSNYSADNYGNLSIGNQVFGGEGHTNTATVNQTSGISIEDALSALHALRNDIAAAPTSAEVAPEDVVDVLDDIDRVMTKGLKRGLGWIKAALIPIATQIATVYGQELADRTLAIGSGIVL